MTIKYLAKSGLKRVSDIIKKWYRRTFTGSLEEWNALTPEQRAKYEVAHIKGAGDSVLVVDFAELGNMNPITSNAVARLMNGFVTAADLEAALAPIIAKNTEQDTAIAGNAANIAANATDISGLKTRMTAAETKNTQQDTAISSLGTRMEVCESKDAAQDESIRALATRVDICDATCASHNNQIQGINSWIAGWQPVIEDTNIKVYNMMKPGVSSGGYTVVTDGWIPSAVMPNGGSITNGSGTVIPTGVAGAHSVGLGYTDQGLLCIVVDQTVVCAFRAGTCII